MACVLDPVHTPLGHCSGLGLLVNATDVVPADFVMHWYPGCPDLVGCNRLRCRDCQADVRQEAGLVMGEAGSEAAAFYAAADWSAWPKVSPYPRARLYACRCGWWNQQASNASLDDDERAHPPWACGGHPGVELPCDLDGVRLEPGMDVERLVRGVLLAGERPPLASRREQGLPSSWVAKLYLWLAHSNNGRPLAEQVGQAAGGLFEEDDLTPVGRGQLLRFYETLPDAPGATALLSRFLSHPAEFVGVSLPEGWNPRRLDERVAWFVNRRARNRQVRGLALDPLTVDVLVRGLTGAEARARRRERGAIRVTEAWLDALLPAVPAADAAFAARARELVQAAPTVAVPLLEAFEAAQSVRLLDVAAEVAGVDGVNASALRTYGRRVGGRLGALLRERTRSG